MTINVAELVDPDKGWVDRRVFLDPEIYALELRRIFARCWIFVAHESQVAAPGDFVASTIGEDAVLVARDRKGEINVVLNSCSHRGNRLSFADAGNTRSFVCNYHGWAFGLAGDLIGVPEERHYAASPTFKKDCLGLKRARVANHGGMIFATFDPDAPSLDDYLGDYRWYLDIMLDNEDGGTEFVGGQLRSVLDCNWKFPAENFAGDAYHAPWTHASGAFAAFDGGSVTLRQDASYHANVNGHCIEFGLDTIGNAATMGEPAVIAWMKTRSGEVANRLGELRSKMWGSVSSANIFPNLGYLPGYSTFRTWVPRGPGSIELNMWALVNRRAPDEVKEAFRRGVMRTFSPTGILEMDDGENWEHATKINSGWVTRHQRLHYALGLESRIDHPELPGNVFAGQINDANQRAFYRRWRDLLLAESWAEVPAS